MNDTRKLVSRRGFLLGTAAAAGTAILAACGGSSATTVPAATTAPTKAAATTGNAGTTAAMTTATVAATAAVTAPASTPATAASSNGTAAPAANATTGTGSAVAAAAPKPEKGKITIAVGGQDQFIYLPVTLAKQLGYFKMMGLDVEIANFSGGAKAAEALVGGSADMVCGFYDHTIQVQPKGETLKTVVLYDQFPGIDLVVGTKGGAGIKGWADLKGKAVGISSAGSSTNTFLNFNLVKNGVKIDDVMIVPVGTGATAIAALENNKVQAAMLTDPAITKMANDGTGKVLWETRSQKDTVDAFGGPYPAGGLYLSQDFITKNPGTTQAAVTASVMTLKYIQTHPPEEIASKMPEEFYGGDKALYIQALKASIPLFSPDGTFPEAGTTSVYNVLKQFDPDVMKATSINLANTYSNQFVMAALQTVK